MEQEYLWKYLSKIATIEDTIKVKEVQYEPDPSLDNRELLMKAQVELTKYLHLEEEYWKQKYGMRWFKDGVETLNSVNGRIKRLALQRI